MKRAQPFEGSFPPLGAPTATPALPHHHLAAAVNDAKMVLAGYEHGVDDLVTRLVHGLWNRQLAALQWADSFGVHANRIPKSLREEVSPPLTADSEGG